MTGIILLFIILKKVYLLYYVSIFILALSTNRLIIYLFTLGGIDWIHKCRGVIK